MDTAQDLQAALVELCQLSNAQAEGVSEYIGSDRDVIECLEELAFEDLTRVCISAALRRARREAEWTDTKACEEHGITKVTLERYENGSPPRQVTKLRMWFSGYGIESGSDLMGGLLAITRASAR